MNERVVIPVKTGIQIFVILSEAKDLAPWEIMIMWLPKEERKLLKSYYNKSGKTRESFELPIYEAIEILGFREDKASAPATNEMFDIALNANAILKRSRAHTI